MAVWGCPRCGAKNDISLGACPGCGREQPRRDGTPWKLLAAIFGALFLLVMCTAVGTKRRTNASAAGGTGTPSAPAAATEATPAVDEAPVATEPVVGRQWSYSAEEDAMTGKASHFASVTSSNTVSFDFPYNGPQNGQLTLRTHPSHGKDVIVSIEKGQILCRSYEDCTIRVRFDDGEPTAWAAVGPADSSTETVFLRNYSGFLSRLKKANRVRIALPVYQEGEPVLEFDVSGFEVARYTGKAPAGDLPPKLP